MRGMLWCRGAAIVVAIGTLVTARAAGAETIDLRCTTGYGGQVVVHLDLDARTAQMIEGRYPILDAQKHEIGEIEPDVEWDVIGGMEHDLFRYNRTTNLVSETVYGEFHSIRRFTWSCATA